MTPREQHSKFSIFQQKIEHKYLPQVSKVIVDEVNRFIATGINPANVMHINLNALYPVLNNMYYQCGYGYGWSVYRQFATVKSAGVETMQHKGMKAAPIDPPVTPQTLADEVMRILRLSLAINVNGMAQSLKDSILDVIQQGYINGWGYEKTAQMVAGQAGLFRARRIVRTESVKASNLSGMTGAKSTGLLMDKRWISARDNRVRGNPGGKYPNAEFDHWNINGTVIGMDRPFTETGEPMQFPGDPNGAAGDVINCRCSLGYIPKRDANGRAIRIAPGFFSQRTTQMYPI
jgi:hypothetical protein